MRGIVLVRDINECIAVDVLLSCYGAFLGTDLGSCGCVRVVGGVLCAFELSAAEFVDYDGFEGVLLTVSGVWDISVGTGYSRQSD